MPTHRTARRTTTARLAALALSAVLLGVACGSTSTGSGQALAPPDDATADDAETAGGTDSLVGDLPAISVIDVTTGADVLLTDLAADERPTLLWMWAPH